MWLILEVWQYIYSVTWIILHNINIMLQVPSKKVILGLLWSMYAETEILSFSWNFHQWLHWKLSKWQLSVQPVMKISSKWWRLRFSLWAEKKYYCTFHSHQAIYVHDRTVHRRQTHCFFCYEWVCLLKGTIPNDLTAPASQATGTWRWQ